MMDTFFENRRHYLLTRFLRISERQQRMKSKVTRDLELGMTSGMGGCYGKYKNLRRIYLLLSYLLRFCYFILFSLQEFRKGHCVT